MNYFAGLDIGGTHGRLKCCALDGTELGTFQSDGCSINTDDPEKSRLRCRELVLPALRSMGLSPDACAGICVAASGVDSPSLEKQMRGYFEEMGFPPQVLQVMNDCEIFLHLSDGVSLALISGTGSICFGRNEQGLVVRTGGWNHIISDEGSGFDMGLKVLKAAADAIDQRISPSLLTEMVIRESGIYDLETLNVFVNEHLFEKSAIARFALTGYRAADAGDETALTIHRVCADALYGLAADTLRKLGFAEYEKQKKVDLWLWGSLLVKNHILRKMLTDKLAEHYPAVRVGIPESSALDVAVGIAGKSGKTGR